MRIKQPTVASMNFKDFLFLAKKTNWINNLVLRPSIPEEQEIDFESASIVLRPKGKSRITIYKSEFKKIGIKAGWCEE